MTIDNRSAGTIWTFAEEDYRYGAGPLRLRIDRVLAGAPVHQDNDLWYEVEGVEVSDQGRVVGPRRATVRASRLPTIRRGPT
ncbi:hypothetical protein [Paractinoplanes maris]|uniref:hypothetical protein n=1 Tax=Paractinoplanes maris TaxID=1734446 RepID=UPI00201FC8DD|nr:hypothetical protein [Actinoplanes maris]